MKNINKISIIVPVYNAKSYLSRCIDSILNQTYQDFELILVDDGSTDCSGEICDKYNSILNYRRLTFFSIPIRFHMCNIIDTVLKQVAKNKNH